MISGLFIALAVGKYGVSRFVDEHVNVPGGLRAGWFFQFVIRYLVPIEFVLMFGWWMYQAAAVYDPETWWHPLHTFSVGTCIAQWGIALALLLYFNRRIAAASVREVEEVR
jgi:NSS family neurotransmitter:Na+ symporter